MSGRYTVQAIENAVRVLLLIAEMPDLGLSDLSRRSGSAKARTYRQLCTLEELGLVTCEPDARTYRLGPAMLALGRQAARQVDIVAVARPHLAWLGQQFGEMIQLRKHEGDETVCVAIWHSTRELRSHGEVGLRRPLHAGSGKVVLAFLPPAEQERILSGTLQRFTAKTPVSLMHLRRELAEIRRTGFCVTRGEVNDGLVSVAAPVILPDKGAWGAINLAARASGVGEKRIVKIASVLKEAAEAIATTMSYALPPPLPPSPLPPGERS